MEEIKACPRFENCHIYEQGERMCKPLLITAKCLLKARICGF